MRGAGRTGGHVSDTPRSTKSGHVEGGSLPSVAESPTRQGALAMNRRTLQILIAVIASMAIAGGAYAFTASNTVPASAAGAGAGAVSGYTVSALHYSLNATT